MPFFSKDWRSPGEAWVKTDDGWEKLKILECRKKFRVGSLIRESIAADQSENGGFLNGTNVNKHSDSAIPQPYCHVTLRCTKEVAGFNGLSDALNRLDFHNAVQDYRRFPYIAKLLNLLLSRQRITTLPGCAQKFLLGLLEEIAVQGQASGQNVHVLQSLLKDLRQILRGDLWWGQPLGSSQLWGQHVQALDRIDIIASSITLPKDVQLDKDPGIKFEDLPEECIRQILFRLADHRDLVSVAEAYAVAQKLSHEQSVWRRLCAHHFSPLQIEFILNHMKKEEEKRSINNSYSANSYRGGHPYRERISRRSPTKENINDINEVQVDNNQTDSRRVPVSSAFRDHINKNRELLFNLQNSSAVGQNLNVLTHHINFQDVRNYLDQKDMAKRGPSTEKLRNSGTKRKEARERKAAEKREGFDWEDLYHRLRRQFGLREEYAETLYLCRQCRCLFWKSLGHPCVTEHERSSKHESLYVPVPPDAFLKFFTL